MVTALRSAFRRRSICARRNRTTTKAACGFDFGALNVQWSMYDMRLTDEIHFRFGPPPTFDANNTNLDPTRRYGHETIATYNVTDAFRLKGGLAFTRAKFRRGRVRRQRRAAGLDLDRQCRLVVGHLAEMADVRYGRALCRPAPHGQRPDQSAAADSGAHDRGRADRRRDREVLLVVRGAESLRRRLFRLCDREPVPVRLRQLRSAPTMPIRSRDAATCSGPA